MIFRARIFLAAILFLVTGSWPAAAQSVLVSAASDGTEGNGDSFSPTISDGGRFVAFVSTSTNLVAGDTNGFVDVFLRDRDADADGVFDEAGAVSTVRVSERAGVQANGPSQEPVITPDGRYVFFASQASTLFAVGQPQLAFFEVFRWDRQTREVVLVSQNEAGEPLNAVSFSPAPTADGNRVFFVSFATNGPPGVDPSGAILMRDIAAGTLTLRGTAPPLGGAGFRRTVEQPSTSADGSVLAYGVADRTLDQNVRVHGEIIVQGQVSPLTLPGANPRISRDGRFLTGIADVGAIPYPAFRRHLPTGEERRVGAFGFSSSGGSSPSGRYVQADQALFVDFDYGSFIGLFLSNDPVAFDGFDRWIAYARRIATAQHVYAIATSMAFDNDSDGLNDSWEMFFGLVTGTGGGASGVNGATGDPDNDGVTNAQEFARGSNPVGNQKRFLAEGTSSADFFSTRIAIANPGTVDARVAVRFDAGDGVGVSRALLVPARTRVTLDSHAESMDGFSFSTVVDGDQPLVVDRLVSWGTAAQGIYGSHAETSTAAPGQSWFLAEGSTVLGFQLFYLLQNPQATATTATVRFLLPSGAPIVRTYELPAQSRTTVYVNTVPGLESTDVSADITATQPIFVERAMYRSTASQVFALGHAAAAVPAPGTTWLFAEGASNAFFDTYLLIANPGAAPATVDVAYLRESGGPLTRTYTVPAGARFSVYVNDVAGLDVNSYGIRVTANAPVVAERAMYWADGYFNYYEGHVSAGATAPGARWVLAESELTATPNALFQAVPFVLIANTGTAPASYRLRTIPEAGGTVRDSGVVSLPAGARLTIPMSVLLASGRFGVEVIEEGTSTGALIVEGAMYWTVNGVPFAAGANWPATRLSP